MQVHADQLARMLANALAGESLFRDAQTGEPVLMAVNQGDAENKFLLWLGTSQLFQITVEECPEAS